MCAVYVDDMNAPYKPKHRPGATYIMCHMIADTEEELHAMAERIGVARRWYQGDGHYDVVLAKKALAIKYGAVAITWPQLSCMFNNRKAGLPLGTPEAAREIAAARIRQALRRGNTPGDDK